MKNLQALLQLEEAHDASIEKLFWIAGQTDNTDLTEFFKEWRHTKEFEEEFPFLPEIDDEDDFFSFGDGLKEGLTDNSKLGFVAEIHIPICDNFRFDEKGQIKGYTPHMGRCRVDFAYGETPDELLQVIQTKAETIFQEFVDKARKELTDKEV